MIVEMFELLTVGGTNLIFRHSVHASPDIAYRVAEYNAMFSLVNITIKTKRIYFPTMGIEPTTVELTVTHCTAVLRREPSLKTSFSTSSPNLKHIISKSFPY